MAKTKGRMQTVIVGFAMEFCWLQAWAFFILKSAFQVQMPVGFVISIYAGGVAANIICNAKERLRIQVLVLKLVIFIPVFYAALYRFVIAANPQLSHIGFYSLSSGQASFAEWVLLVVLMLIAGVVWLSSGVYINQQLSLHRVYLRFDLAVCAMLALMLVKLVALARYDISLSLPALLYLSFPLLLFGFVLVGTVLNAEGHLKTYDSGFQKIGVILSFSAVTLVCGFGFVSLFHSQLNDSAEVVSSMLKKAGPPLGEGIIWLVRLLFSSKQRFDPSSTSGGQNAAPAIPEMVAEPSLLETVFKWGLAGLMMALLLLICLILLQFLVKFLFSGSRLASSNGFAWGEVRDWFFRGYRFACLIVKKCLTLFRQIRTAEDLYHWLLIWGRHSGIPIGQTDTLVEYQNRITHVFPDLADEVGQIVTLIYQESYRQTVLDREQIKSGKIARKRMRHPEYWPGRLKSWIFSGRVRALTTR